MGRGIGEVGFGRVFLRNDFLFYYVLHQSLFLEVYKPLHNKPFISPPPLELSGAVPGESHQDVLHACQGGPCARELPLGLGGLQ